MSTSSNSPSSTPAPTSLSNNPSGAIHPTVFMVAWVVLSFGLTRFLPFRLPAWPILELVGTALTLGGVLIFLWSFLEFRRHGTTLEHSKPTTALVTGGPFRFSRNPIYLGLIAIFLGLALDHRSPWAALLTIPFALAVHHLTVLREEAYLERRFGDEYRAYLASVRRWL